MLRRIFLPLFMIALVTWAIGCSDNPTTTTPAETSMDEAFGGYTTADETPGFGDTELLASEDDEVEIDDPLLSNSQVQAMVNDIEYGMFHFRAVWGQLEYDSTFTTETDWTGSLTVNDGALIVRRLIRFEPATDYLVERTDRKLVEFVSITTVHNDGIAVDLYVPPRDPMYDTTLVIDGDDTTVVVDTIMPEPVTLTFEAGQYSRTFTLDELAALDEVVELEDGNSIAFHGVQFFRQACPRGMLAGFWGFDEEGNGVFKGMWFSRFGYVAGFLQGDFGEDESGNRVYYGKWIDRSGQFEGLLKGTWGHHPSTNAADIARRRAGGWFEGGVFDANGGEIGQMRGIYKSAPRVAGGWFQGRWKLNCFDKVDDDSGVEVMNDGI